ncbi:MAG TPA: hypothetical protein VFF73_21235 [Planctomycetota bacterium]|nr:hypothetical protein [Planctomycetota bacterium]
MRTALAASVLAFALAPDALAQSDPGLTADRLDKIVTLLEKLDEKGVKLPANRIAVGDREAEIATPARSGPLGDAQAAAGIDWNHLQPLVDDFDKALRALVLSRVSDDALKAAFDKATKDLSAEHVELAKTHGEERLYTLYKQADAAREKWFPTKLRAAKAAAALHALGTKMRQGYSVDPGALKKATDEDVAASKEEAAAEHDLKAAEEKISTEYYKAGKDAAAAEKDPDKREAASSAALEKQGQTYDALARARQAQSTYFALLVARAGHGTGDAKKGTVELLKAKERKLVPLLKKLDSPLAALLK